MKVVELFSVVVVIALAVMLFYAAWSIKNLPESKSH